jgi:hypothetical protein
MVKNMTEENTTETPQEKEEKICGIVMPISATESCSSDHWAEVLRILKEVASEAGLSPTLVSDSNDVGIIQKRIIQNLYSNDIVLCDVSAKNPNVMFELGLRLAFDKPTIIIKDDKTSYSFDTAPIEHLEYPRDLRYTKILSFRKSLKEKIIGTLSKFEADPSASTFLKEFGEFHVARLETKEVSSDEFIVEALNDIRGDINSLRRTQSRMNEIRNRGSMEEIVALIESNLEEIADARGIQHPYLKDEILALADDIERIPAMGRLCGSSRTLRRAVEIVANRHYEEPPF